MSQAVQAELADTPKTVARSFRNLSKFLVMGVVAFGVHAASHAAVFTEDFNAPFPAWESGFFGVNSNAVNFVCGTRGCPDRGFNNEEGLYVAGPGQTTAIDVAFNTAFAGTITSFMLDVAAVFDTTLLAFDISGAEIFRSNVDPTSGPFITAADYTPFTINSSNGISRFAFTDDSGSTSSAPPAGSTVIDNLRVTTRDPVTPTPGVVPEPGSIALLGLGLAGIVAARRRSRGANRQSM